MTRNGCSAQLPATASALLLALAACGVTLGLTSCGNKGGSGGMAALSGIASVMGGGDTSGGGADRGALGNALVGGGVDSRWVDIAQGAGDIVDSLDLENDPRARQTYGEAVAVGLLARYDLDKDEDLAAYVNLVGLSLVDAAQFYETDFVFGVLAEDARINALSTPNGVVLVTRAALRTIEDEAELAGVLAHEIAHVMKNHGVKAVKDEKFWKGALKAGLGADGNYAALAGAGTDFLLLRSFSKQAELEADAGAVTIASAAGYDPAGLARFLARVEARADSKGQDGISNLMSTHPHRPERIAAINELARNRSGLTLRDRYQSSAAARIGRR